MSQKKGEKNVFDIFDLSKNVERVVIREGAVNGHVVPNPDFQRSNVVSRSSQNYGREYVQKYKEEEERLLLEGVDNSWPALSSSSGTLPRSKMCEMEELTSVGSAANLADLDGDRTQVYRTYKFDPALNKGLLIEKSKLQIVRMVDTNQVVIIQGPTGCGKTTQVPQYILDDHARQNKWCNIVVTQPRRIAATSVSKRVCQERGWELSTIVGYQIGMDNKTSPDTRLTFCTTGVLREKLVAERSMTSFTHVILDEVHERDIEMDFLLLVVRKLLRFNSRQVKVILMSATIDCDRFASYFSLPLNDKLIAAPVLHIEKSEQRFKVSEFYLDQLTDIGPLPDVQIEEPVISDNGFNVAVRLIQYFDFIDREEFENKHKVPPKKDSCYKHAVLVFLPGIHEIEEMYNRLNDKTEGGKYCWHILRLHSTVTREEQMQVFLSAAPGFRKVILSTNIAESSITVPDVKYVIDFCLTKHLQCDVSTNFTCLQLAWASRFSCIQRAGRAGRVMVGRVYRLVPRSFYERYLTDEITPEMHRCPLEQTVLKSKMLRMGDPKQILAMALDPPDLSTLETTILVLKEAGAMLLTSGGKRSDFDGDMTFLGHVMANLPLDIHLTKLIMLGHVFSILEECIIIAACMSVRNLFTQPFHDRFYAYGTKLTYSGGLRSDCIAYLTLYQSYNEKVRSNFFKQSTQDERRWAANHYVNLRALCEVRELVQELTQRLKNLGVVESAAHGRVTWSKFEKPLILKIVIAGAFYPHYYVRGAQGGQVNEEDAVKTLAGEDPFHSVFLQGMPPNQPGELYAKTIKEALSLTGAQSINLSFDGSSKVYVRFNDKTNESISIPGRISMAVYNAVKMRQLKYPVTVHLLPVEAAKKRAIALGLESDRLLSLGKTTAPNKQFPSPEVELIEFTPSFIINPNKFWIHLGVQNTLTWLNERLNEPDVTTDLEYPVKVGGTYAARYSDGLNYRAVVLSVDERAEAATVYFVDYGNTEETSFRYLREFDSDLAMEASLKTLPPMAIECSLVEIKPLETRDGRWDENAIMKFERFMKMRDNLLGEIYSSVDNILYLRVKFPGSEKTVNELLIEEEVAEKAEESLRSKRDHERRCQIQNYSGTVGRNDSHSMESKLLPWDVKEDPEPPSQKECRSQVTLRGPMSPLEMKVYGCSNATAGKDVAIDHDSVNSVLLDANPEDPLERLLVAGSVSQNPSGTRLNLRHTTLMPMIPGLPALVTLIFAPVMELRRNPDKTFYSGMVCGLGRDPKTNESLFPEHDLEITFDHEIDVEDLEKINNVRYCMNVPLMSREGEDVSDATLVEVLNCQKKIKENIMDLLRERSKRKKLDLYIFPRSFTWGQFDEADLLSPNKLDSRHVFPMHYGLDLMID